MGLLVKHCKTVLAWWFSLDDCSFTHVASALVLVAFCVDRKRQQGRQGLALNVLVLFVSCFLFPAIQVNFVLGAFGVAVMTRGFWCSCDELRRLVLVILQGSVPLQVRAAH